MGDPLTNQPIR